MEKNHNATPTSHEESHAKTNDDNDGDEKEEHDKQHARKISSMEGERHPFVHVPSPQYQQYHHRHNPSSGSLPFYAYASSSYDSHFDERKYHADHPPYDGASQYKDANEGERYVGGVPGRGGACHNVSFSPQGAHDEAKHQRAHTPQGRGYEERAIVTPSRSTLHPTIDPSARPHFYDERPYNMPPYTLSSPSDKNMKVVTQSPESGKKMTSPSKYVYTHPILAHHQRHPYDDRDRYDPYVKETYHDSPYCAQQTRRGGEMTSMSAPHHQRGGSNSHFSYTFDRHGALVGSYEGDDSPPYPPHRGQQYDPASLATSPYAHAQYSPGYYQHPGEDRWSHVSPPALASSDIRVEYYQQYPQVSYSGDQSDDNKAHPLLRGYNPDNDSGGTAYPPRDAYADSPKRDDSSSTGGTDHKASFHMMIEDPTVVPPMPKAASEVDFDVMNPPLTPVIEPSKSDQHSSPESLTMYDVLLGRGGGTNSQIGNRHFRSLVHEFQPLYLSMKRKDKPLMARSLVLIIRRRGGRFLQKDEESNKYFEVGDEKAEAKASQALREGLKIRAITKKRKEVIREQKRMENERKKRAKYDLITGRTSIEAGRTHPQNDYEEPRVISRGYYQQGGGIYDYHRTGPEEPYHRGGYENLTHTYQQGKGGRYEPPEEGEERRIRGGGEQREEEEQSHNQELMSQTERDVSHHSSSCDDEYDSSTTYSSTMSYGQHANYEHPPVFESSTQQAAGLSTAASFPSENEQRFCRARSLSGDDDEQRDGDFIKKEKDEKIHIVPI